MFDSGITAKAVIDEVKMDIDTAPDISDITYISIINELEQFLYSSIILEQNEVKVDTNENRICETPGVTGNDEIRFEDIAAIYAGGRVQLMKTTLATCDVLENTYAKCGKNSFKYNLCDNMSDETTLRMVYYVRPVMKTSVNEKIMLPVEFISLVKAKLRAEAYMIANEFNTASQWIIAYNTLLEHFKAYIAQHRPEVGV